MEEATWWLKAECRNEGLESCRDCRETYAIFVTLPTLFLVPFLLTQQVID